jgi:hypothetical protein
MADDQQRQLMTRLGMDGKPEGNQTTVKKYIAKLGIKDANMIANLANYVFGKKHYMDASGENDPSVYMQANGSFRDLGGVFIKLAEKQLDPSFVEKVKRQRKLKL